MAKKKKLKKPPAFCLCRDKHYYNLYHRRIPKWIEREKQWAEWKRGDYLNCFCAEIFEHYCPDFKLKPGEKKRVRIQFMPY